MTTSEVLRRQVKKYIDKADDKSLQVVMAILEIESGEDHETVNVENDEVDWNKLPKELQAIIDSGIREGDEGKGIPHDQIKEKYSKWFR